MHDLTRRSFLRIGAATGALQVAPPLCWSSLGRPAVDRPAVVWTDLVEWPIEGRAFEDRKAPYDRLPARAESAVRKAVWDLSRHSAGMLVRFATDSPELHVRYRLSNERLAMSHMPATGVSGVDLYGLGDDGWRWIDVTRPGKQDVKHRFFTDRPTAAPRHFQLYLPLYNGVDQLELGTADGAELASLPARTADKKPIACYGTSIMHGACASRPGMAWTAILGRQLDREVINLGFSGNGRMEIEVGQFLAELDPAVFVVDCLPNMSPKLVAERTQPLVRQLRAARPDTPILLVEDRTFANAWFHEGRLAAHEQRRAALRSAFAALQADGVEHLHLLSGEGLLGDDGEGTTDGSHPNDLGMTRQAAAVRAALAPILG